MLGLLLLVGLCPSCHLNVLFRKDAKNASCDFVVYNRLVVLGDDVDAEFLVCCC